MACLFKGISIQVQYSIDGCLKPGEAFFQPRTNDGRRVCLQGLQGLRQGPLLGSHVRFPRSQRVDQLPLVHDDVGIFRPPTMECGWDTWLLKWMRDWPANLLIEHQHHVAAMSLNMSNSCVQSSWDLLPQTAPSRLMGGERQQFVHNTRHLIITGGFAYPVVGDTVHTNTDFQL